MPHEKLYSDKEIGKIIERAYKLQQADEAAKGYGLNETELQKLASEMGIDAKYLRQALQDPHGNEKAAKGHFWGAPMQVEDEILVQGEVSNELWEEMVLTLRNTFKNRGLVEQLGKTRSWVMQSVESKSSAADVVVITLSTKNGQTKISLKEERQSLQIGLVLSMIIVPLIVFILTMLGTGKNLWLSFGTSLTSPIGLTFLWRWIISNFIAPKQTEGQKAIRQLAEMVDKVDSQASSQQNQAVTKPLLDLSNLAPLPDTESTSERSRVKE